jgi:ABC-type polysaccharide/polyol phosphate export permease
VEAPYGEAGLRADPVDLTMQSFNDVSANQVPVVRPNGSQSGLAVRSDSPIAHLVQVWERRGLVGHLAQRELKGKYKRNVLGWLWSLLNPASTLLIYAVVFGTIMRITPPVAGNGEQSFALYLFSGLVIWNAFNGMTVGSIGALMDTGSLLRKVYFPPACPAIAHALTVVLQAVLEMVILVVAMSIVGNVGWTFLLFPYLLLLLALFCLGIGLVLSIFNVYLRDIGHLVNIGINMLFYGTPIIYTFELVEDNAPGWVAELVRLNPLTHFVGAAQEIFYLLEVPSAQRLLYLTGASIASFVVGWVVFVARSADVSEEL